MTLLRGFLGAFCISIGAIFNWELVWYFGIPLDMILIFIGLTLMDSNDANYTENNKSGESE